MFTYETFIYHSSSSSALHFLREHFKRTEIESPTLDDIRKIPEYFLESSWISIKTMKEILLLQQQLKK